jgi:CheY-specific phosphatase CheX
VRKPAVPASLGKHHQRKRKGLAFVEKGENRCRSLWEISAGKAPLTACEYLARLSRTARGHGCDAGQPRNTRRDFGQTLKASSGYAVHPWVQAPICDPEGTTTQLQKALDELVVDCAIALFESADITLTRVEAALQPCELVGIIGFAGTGIRGVVGLSMSPKLASRALNGTTESEPQLDDWVAEAANQLLGRIKNRLLQRGITISAALPIVLRGIEVRVAQRTAAPIRVYRFAVGSESVVVWLDLQTHGEIVLADAVAPTEQPMDEGDMLLF